MAKILIHGGSSLISKYLIEELYNNTDEFHIFCRSEKKTKEIINLEKYNSNKFFFYENDLKNIDLTLSDIEKLPNDLTGIFWISGYDGFPKQEITNVKLLEENLKVNFLNIVICINFLLKKLILKKNNFICVHTSVAGLRGRKQKLFYSAAKAGMINYLSGLRQLYNNKLKIVTVIPGYISTNAFDIKAPKFLITSPKKSSQIVINGINSNKEIIYINWVWRLIMIVIKLIPEKIFKKLNF